SLAEVARYRHEYEILKVVAGEQVAGALALEHVGHRPVLVTQDTGYLTLADRFAASRPSLETFLRTAIALARAVAAVHARGVIHKDLHPRNILVLVEDVGCRVKLLDFGIATRLSRESQGLAHPDNLEGTLAYLSPEQTGRVNRAIDARSDLYSVGATLHWLASGALPFQAPHALGYVHCHIAVRPPRLDEIARGTPAIVADIVAKLLAKSADDRYQSAVGLARDLEECLRRLGTGEVGPFPLGAGDVAEKFEVPQRLYGRERQVATLLGAFERVAGGGGPQPPLRGATSGIGKSALVAEIHRPIVARRGTFIAGKFDQYNRNVPYSAVSSAFAELVHYILMEPPERVAAWRRAIADALGGNGKLLVDVVP